jgi:hypothetical protein
MRILFAIVCTVVMLSTTRASATPPDPVADLIIETGAHTAVATFTPTTGGTWFEVRVWESAMSAPSWSGYYLLAYGGCTPGTPICVDLSNLDSCHDWYWAVRLYGAGGWSEISNQSHESTRCPPQYGEVECTGRRTSGWRAVMHSPWGMISACR